MGIILAAVRQNDALAGENIDLLMAWDRICTVSSPIFKTRMRTYPIGSTTFFTLKQIYDSQDFCGMSWS